MIDILILLGGFVVLCMLGVPVAYALGLAALARRALDRHPARGGDDPDLRAASTSFSLLAIPFFVLAGAIMAEGGMAARLVNLAQGVRRRRSAAAWRWSTSSPSTFFGCISGSSVADTASIGSVMIPQMVKQGYPRVFATNVTICGSVQALLIPPSHNAVHLLARRGRHDLGRARCSSPACFPGLLFGLCLIGLVLWIAHKRNMPKSEPIPLKDMPKIVLEALWGLVTIVIIMGGILSGVFTPTESAAVACVYAFLVTFFVYRDYKWRDLPHLVHRVVKTVAMVMMLIGFSVGFGYMMALMQIPAKVTMFFLAISENKYVFLLLVNILLLVLGTFMDLAPMLLICTPIFLPVIVKLGIDPVHFGMIMILNLGIGLITPPVGPTLFVGCAIGKVTIERCPRSCGRSTARCASRCCWSPTSPAISAMASRSDEMSSTLAGPKPSRRRRRNGSSHASQVPAVLRGRNGGNSRRPPRPGVRPSQHRPHPALERLRSGGGQGAARSVRAGSAEGARHQAQR